MLRVIRFLNGLITFVVVIVLVVSAAYAGYSLWDNQQVYDAVENNMDEMRAIRAQIEMPKTQTGIAALIASKPTTAPTPDPTSKPVAVLQSEENSTEQTVDISSALVEEQPVVVQESHEEAAQEVPVEVMPDAEGQPVVVQESHEETMQEVPVNELAMTNDESIARAQNDVFSGTPTPAPSEEPVDDSPFGQLKAINPDITAWITMPGTAIDYPVLQGSSNYSYINTDVFGEFALAGSIFLDYRNDKSFQDNYSLLYGHDMSQNRMFSDVNLYKDKEFFEDNHLGILLTPDGNHLLQSIACVVTSAGNSSLFNPENWKSFTPEQILQAVQEDAILIDPEGLEALKERLEEDDGTDESAYHVVALSTCSGEFTDARTILLTLMDP